MFRGVCLLGLLIGLVSSGGGAWADWFKDPHRQYYVDIPAGWFSNAYEDESGERVAAFAAVDGGVVVRIRAVPATKAVRPGDLRPAFEAGVLGGAIPVATGVARFGSRKAVVATYRWMLGGVEYSVVARYVVAEKFGRRTGFIVWRMVPAEDEGRYGAVADGVVGSFGFLRPMAYRSGSSHQGGIGLAAAPPSARGLLGDLSALGTATGLSPDSTPSKPEPSAPSVAASETVVPAIVKPSAEPTPPAPTQPVETPPAPTATTTAPTQPVETPPVPTVTEATEPASTVAEQTEPVPTVAEPTEPAPTAAEPTEPVPTESAESPPAPTVAESTQSVPAVAAGPLECLEAASARECGCTMGALQNAFAELEDTYFSSMDAAEERRKTAESLKADMDTAADGCPKPLYRRVVRLVGDNTDPDVAWAVSRAEKVRQCGSLFIARIEERREREPSNRTLDSIIEVARVLKYDSLLLLAEFEKVEAARGDARRILRNAMSACELIHGPMK
jgi:hypothetical protein